VTSSDFDGAFTFTARAIREIPCRVVDWIGGWWSGLDGQLVRSSNRQNRFFDRLQNVNIQSMESMKFVLWMSTASTLSSRKIHTYYSRYIMVH
jgi:hypothetical protein